MKFKATIPNSCVICASSKYMPPIPSEPASIPISKKRISVGMPSLNEVLLARILAMSNKEQTSMICSAENIPIHCDISEYTKLLLYGPVKIRKK